MGRGENPLLNYSCNDISSVNPSLHVTRLLQLQHSHAAPGLLLAGQRFFSSPFELLLPCLAAAPSWHPLPPLSAHPGAAPCLSTQVGVMDAESPCGCCWAHCMMHHWLQQAVEACWLEEVHVYAPA